MAGPASSAASGINLDNQPAASIKAVTMTGDCAPFGQYGKYNGTPR